MYENLARVGMNKILVIEDDPQLGDLELWQEAYYHEIRQGYYDFDVAKSGEEAIEKIEADKDHEIKFLVVDIRMPRAKMDGEGFLKWLTSANLAKKFAIIVFTALPGKAGEILNNLHIPSWILAKGSISEQLNQLKDLRALFKQAMNFANDWTNGVTNSSVPEVISDIEVIEKSLGVLSVPKLEQLHDFSESLLNRRKLQQKSIRTRYLREWVSSWQKKGYFAELTPINDIHFVKWVAFKSSYNSLKNASYTSSGNRTYYKLNCSSPNGRLQVNVPIAIIDSFLSVVAKIQAEEEQMISSGLESVPQKILKFD